MNNLRKLVQIPRRTLWVHVSIALYGFQGAMHRMNSDF